MDKIKLRKHAIMMYLNGRRTVDICNTVNRNRPWFYKWLKRYQSNPKGDWFLEQSRRPHTIHTRINKDLENIVIQIRKELENTLYSQIGAISIQWELEKLNIELPPIWTINRIIKRHELTRKRNKPRKRQNEYPDYGVFYTHQLDLVGPRYIKRSGKVYFCNIIDTDTHCVHVNPIKNKASKGVLDTLVRFWKQFGIPDYLQMDNELSFRGSNRHSHSFGKLIRFALSQDVTPVFIPPGEPWRNGIIEKFNDTFDKKFFRTQVFKDFDYLVLQANKFETFHNLNYHYSANQNRTPVEMHTLNFPIYYIDKNYDIQDDISLESGDIVLIRFIRSNRKLNIFGETFLVKPELIYNYVEAIISVKGQALKIYLDNKFVQEFPYLVPVDLM